MLPERLASLPVSQLAHELRDGGNNGSNRRTAIARLQHGSLLTSDDTNELASALDAAWRNIGETEPYDFTVSKVR